MVEVSVVNLISSLVNWFVISKHQSSVNFRLDFNTKSLSLEHSHQFSNEKVLNKNGESKMNLTLFGTIALMAFVSDSSAEFGGGFGGPGAFGGSAGFGGPAAGFGGMFAPPAAAAGRMAGQEASKNAVDLAVNSAMSKVNITELPPELQVKLQPFFISNILN